MKRALDLVCGLLAAAALFAIMALTLVDVSGRKLMAASVPGSLEVTELLLVTVIFAGLPLVSLRGEHIVFDSLDAVLPPALRRAQTAAVDALCAVALGALALLMWRKAGELAAYGDTTALLRIPQAPFVYGMSVLCGVAAAVHALLIRRPAVRSGGIDERRPG